MLYVGWKSIAEACNISTKTARRWHKNHGLPVRFIDRKPTITTEGINEWWQGIDINEETEEIQ